MKYINGFKEKEVVKLCCKAKYLIVFVIFKEIKKRGNIFTKIKMK